MPPRLEQEGQVYRVTCECGARSAGTLTYEEALALGAAHRCRVKPLPKPCSGCGRPRVECVCLLSLPGMP